MHPTLAFKFNPLEIAVEEGVPGKDDLLFESQHANHVELEGRAAPYV